jgi:SH3-like domain-containing protein
MMPHAGCRALLHGALALAALAGASVTNAADYRATTEAPTLLYDAPSAKSKALFVYGRDVPMEVLVSVEGWTKVRDIGGTIGWIASKGLGDKRMLQIRVPVAEVRANPDDAAAIVFRAEQNVLVELAESASSPANTFAPGWVRVRHRDGQVGFVRVPQVFGL